MKLLGTFRQLSTPEEITRGAGNVSANHRPRAFSTEAE